MFVVATADGGGDCHKRLRKDIQYRKSCAAVEPFFHAKAGKWNASKGRENVLIISNRHVV